MAQLKRSKKVPRVGIVYVHITYNNTIITITDNQGNTLLWHSGGRSQKGARKATGHAAPLLAQPAHQSRQHTLARDDPSDKATPCNRNARRVRGSNRKTF